MEDELSDKIMTKLVGLRAKTYSYLIDDGSEDEKAKGAKKCVIKRELKLEDHKSNFTWKYNKPSTRNEIHVDILKKCHNGFKKNNLLSSKTQQRFKPERQNVFTPEINKFALSLLWTMIKGFN